MKRGLGLEFRELSAYPGRSPTLSQAACSVSPGGRSDCGRLPTKVAVNTLVVTVKLPDGPRLAIDEFTNLHLLGVKSYGKDAAVHALRAIARSLDAELRLHAEMYRPTHTRCSGNGDARTPQDLDSSGRPACGTRGPAPLARKGANRRTVHCRLTWEDRCSVELSNRTAHPAGR